MSSRLDSLIERIQNELVELEYVVERVETGWQRAKLSGDDYYLDSVALNLHGLYNGLERVFEQIAMLLDGSQPRGENWHQLLLTQMAKEVIKVRPAVISDSSYVGLDELRGFRHVVRNVYTFKFNPQKLDKLVSQVGPLYKQVQLELMAFADFLESAKDE